MEWSDTALVLRVGRFREADMWVHLLTPHRGLVQAFAFGGSRSRRRFCGCLDLLNTLSCRAHTTRNGAYLNLEEGTLLRVPRGLRTDYRRLGVAMNCVRFTEALGVTLDTAEATYALLDNTVLFLDAEAAPQGIFPLQFRLRLACEQGQAPALDVCGQCGTAVEEGHFRVDEGQMLCARCAAQLGVGRYHVRLDRQAVAALRRVQSEDPEAWGALPLDGESRRQCARAIDGFVQYHLGIAWQEGRFCRV